MTKTITLLTGNERKKKSFEKSIEGFDVLVDIQNPWIPEIQSTDNAEVAAYSAQYGANLLHKLVIKIDSGFFIDGLNGFPGPLLHYVDIQVGADLFFKLLADLQDRTAHIKNCLAYCEPGEEPIIFSSGCSGIIVDEIRPKPGTFIDRLFIADHPNNPERKTMGEIREADFNTFLSLWGDADLQFVKWFVENK